MNKYVEPIINKSKKHDFKSWLQYRKIIKYCKRLSPSFDDLWEIGDFIRILRNSYMYSNNSSFHLFLGTLPKNFTILNSRSIFYKEEDFSIGFVLLKESKTISIEITRSGQTIKSEKENIEFIDGQYIFKDKYDEAKFQFITSSLMNSVVELITYYYKNKKF